MFRRRWTVPVIQHLPGQDSIEHKARHESVQDELVIHLLQRREDASQTTQQVVEDGERAELARPTLLVDSDDLWQLGGDAKKAGASLQRRHHGRRDERVGYDERVDGRRDERDEPAREPGSVLEEQDEDADGDVLDGDQGGLAVGAEGESVADIVGERDEEGGRLEDVGRKADPLRGARL